MSPIISPWIIYFIGMTEPLIIMMGITAIASLVCLIASSSDGEVKNAKVSLIVLVISVLALIVVPSKETCYKMLVASYITTDNVKAVVNQGNLKAVRDGVKLDVRDLVKAVVEPVTDSIIKVQKEENK